MIENKVVVGISQGDLNGVGLEIILKTLSDPAMLEICVPVLFSSQKTVSYFRKMLNLEDFNFNPLRDFNQVHTKKPNVFICYEEEVTIEMGKATAMAGKYARLSLEAATQALHDKKIDVLVTAPINKHNMQEAGFNYPGHTEYLGEKLEGKPLMLLCSGDLRVAVVTGHVPIKDVAQHITSENIISKITQLHTSLVKDFGIRKPKIAVLGLNPHAGENGAIGEEEQNVIIPAINKAKETMMVYGPYSADGFFGNNTQSKFDGVLAMYHDQGLIPFKALAFGSGVNFTAGLNFVRTSPDHGTAYDIAGKQIADESSFREALYAAIDIYKRRMLHEEINTNPLAFTPIKKERG
ncbi:MAG: 4-hydroxythreonine-4-phosphate dehydrogenase PdxA [Burkholderiales bacterium]|nr:4-hydroxythreonine-4-phosphate dehydrogenase PdxA [Bacteroidia bacterium]